MKYCLWNSETDKFLAHGTITRDGVTQFVFVWVDYKGLPPADESYNACNLALESDWDAMNFSTIDMARFFIDGLDEALSAHDWSALDSLDIVLDALRHCRIVGFVNNEIDWRVIEQIDRSIYLESMDFFENNG